MTIIIEHTYVAVNIQTIYCVKWIWTKQNMQMWVNWQSI